MNEGESIQGERRGSPWVAYSIIAIIAIGALVSFYVSQEKDIASREQRRERRIAGLERGPACAPLSRGRAALRSDDIDALASSLKDAEREALRALDTSGVSFGKPERIALLLASDLRAKLRPERRDFVADRLDAAEEACSELRSS